ncbi:hypothetical protein, partial [Candidatus Laterigemmans baculatus]|uniref:hypothetical protein n=1 Tax=Candidatus Laterigemmans baculatus TaxID=2770505 RepID=UPI00193EFD87
RKPAPGPRKPAPGPRKPAPGHRLPASRLRPLASGLLSLALLFCLAWALGVTGAGAHSQAAVFASQAVRSSSLLSLQPLLDAESRLSERLAVEPGDYAMLLERTAVRVQLFRLQEAAKVAGTSQATQQAAYDHSRLKDRRQEYYDTQTPLAPNQPPGASPRFPETGTLPPGGSGSQARGGRAESLPDRSLRSSQDEGGDLVDLQSPAAGPNRTGAAAEPEASANGSSSPPGTGPRLPATGNRPPYLLAAASDARAALESIPLSPEARIWLVRLDFVTGETELTAERLEQIAQLRSGSLVTLDRVFGLAVQSRHWDVARDAASQTIHISTAKIPEVLKRLRNETPLRASDVVPEERAAILAAAEYELRHPDPDPAILSAAQNHLSPALSDQERALKERIDSREPGAGSR